MCKCGCHEVSGWERLPLPVSAEVSNLFHCSARSQVTGWVTPGKEEKQAQGQHLASRDNRPHPAPAPNPDSHRFETSEENMAGPSKSNTTPHRELGFHILDLAGQRPSPSRNPRILKC